MYQFILSNTPWFWLAVLVICCIIEGLTMGLTTIWGAIAAIPMIFLARTGMAIQWQFLIFVTITLVLVIFTRPFAVKKLKTGRTKTNVETMIGEEVLVTKSCSNIQKGEAKAKNGVIWSILCSDNNGISEGEACIIEKIEGNTLFVKKITKTGEN